MKKSSPSKASATAVIVVFAVLCFMVVLFKAVYDYNRFNSTYEKIMYDYNVGSVRNKLLDIAKSSTGFAAVAAAAVVPSAAAVKKTVSRTPLIASKKKQPSSSHQPPLLEWSGGTTVASPSSSPRGANNCLFDATIEACGGLVDTETNSRYNSQKLREKCDDLLRAEGFPLIPHGEPAGEQYLQALSRLLNKKVKVYKGTRENFVAEIKHSDVSDEADSFSIVHLGSQLNGHWVAH